MTKQPTDIHQTEYYYSFFRHHITILRL